MDALRERIITEGRNLGRGILKIDGFLNHQLDVALLEAVGVELAGRFVHYHPTRILTAEVSGIIPAAMVARALNNLPVVYARKKKPVTMMEPVFVEEAPSHTKGHNVSLMVSPEFLSAQDRILIVDDFLASGKTIDALARIVKTSGATLVGITAVVEKTFEGGRDFLQYWQVPIETAAMIVDMSDGKIVLQ
ncbi:MAG: xanthine phosphoribosyltransferase [Chloroflexi bacterium]|nr:xanthine phosphoribosyltransferase [Chloroflexota bacterium]MBP8054928.1 xanthine phosphoribosyltransferase [Chloroflexota bacterium]